MTLEQALEQYHDVFGENYPLYVCYRSDEEEIEKILRCIQSGEKAKEPVYKPGAIYYAHARLEPGEYV